MLSRISGETCAITAVDYDVARGPGDQERSDVVLSHVIEIAGDTEWFCSAGCPPAGPGSSLFPDEEHCADSRQPENEEQDVFRNGGKQPHDSRSLHRFYSIVVRMPKSSAFCEHRVRCW